VCNSSRCACDGNNDCRILTTTAGTCSQGRCNCGGNVCQRGEYCRTVSSQTQCSCNGEAGCAAVETCCQNPAGCFNLDTDVNNCGGCGFACGAGQTCVNGSCT
jgi:hypothetical protein